MNGSLFSAPTKYDPEFDQCWKLYWSRGNSKTCSKKFVAAEAWRKTRSIRPPHPIMLLCIKAFLDDIESTKQVRNNGRDVIVTYKFKEHFSSWLNGRGWEDVLERATASLALAQNATTDPQKPTQPQSLQAPSLSSRNTWPPPGQEPKRTRQEILDSLRTDLTSYPPPSPHSPHAAINAVTQMVQDQGD